MGWEDWLLPSGTQRPTVAPTTTQFHRQDSSPSTESSRIVKNHPLASLCYRGIRFVPWQCRLVQHLPTAFLIVQPLQSWPRRRIALGTSGSPRLGPVCQQWCQQLNILWVYMSPESTYGSQEKEQKKLKNITSDLSVFWASSPAF